MIENRSALSDKYGRQTSQWRFCNSGYYPYNILSIAGSVRVLEYIDERNRKWTGVASGSVASTDEICPIFISLSMRKNRDAVIQHLQNRHIRINYIGKI